MTQLQDRDYAAYYKVFYDVLSAIAKNFDGKVIKYVGDALLIYFPSTSDPTDRGAFKRLLDCGMAMIRARCDLNNTLHEENLPSMSYRISADYGRMQYVETEEAQVPDWVSPSMNMVAKINRVASENSMVIGGDLRQILSRFFFKEYAFDMVGELGIGIKQRYPIYSVISTDKSVSDLGKCAVPPIHVVTDRTPSSLQNIVIVDDEEDVLLTCSEYFSGHRVNVEAFSDPRQLLARIAVVGPCYYDLAILDMKMPVMSGLQVYRFLDALKPGISTLFITALADAEDLVCLLPGFNKSDVLKKPFSREHLLSAVNKKIKIYA
ncbi:MAG: response regulator [Nitrososphaera sp.]